MEKYRKIVGKQENPFSNRGFKWKINYTWRFRAAKIKKKREDFP